MGNGGRPLEGQPLNAFFAQQSPAPGREGSAPPAPVQATQAPPGGGAPPPQGQPAGGGAFMMLMPVLLIVMMLLMTRGQNKKQKELETFQSGLKKGDTVVTTAGLIGRVTEVGERE